MPTDRTQQRVPLRCHLCGAGTQLLTAGATLHERVFRGVARLYATLTCHGQRRGKACGNVWDSRNPLALDMARRAAADAGVAFPDLNPAPLNAGGTDSPVENSAS